MDVELAEAVSSQRSLEAERDRALAEKELAVAEKERAISDFLQSPAFKEACLEKFADYYDSWLGTEAGIKKMGAEGTKWLETRVYHGIQLVLRETVPSSSHPKIARRPPPSLAEDAESRTCSWWYRAKRLERRIECLQRLMNYLHGVPKRPAPPVEAAQPAADAIPAEGTSFVRATPPCSFLMADSAFPSFATAPTAVGKCVDPDLPSSSEESIQGRLRQEPAVVEVSKRSRRLVRKVGTDVRAYLEGFRHAHRKKTISTNFKTQFVTDHDASSLDSSFSEEMAVYFDHSRNSTSHSCA
ncbi:unnamed protein product [Cuscuta campestris]|uniref:Uncharacterized protein n=1 Tax=Cuscuta campestris TaxID=132261 RepID=A0A484MDL3_9ASTE|nr:unnamed protein product [Cuscuta campestris]